MFNLSQKYKSFWIRRCGAFVLVIMSLYSCCKKSDDLGYGFSFSNLPETFGIYFYEERMDFQIQYNSYLVKDSLLILSCDSNSISDFYYINMASFKDYHSRESLIHVKKGTRFYENLLKQEFIRPKLCDDYKPFLN